MAIKDKRDIQVTDVWELYQKGIDYIHRINLVSQTDEAHRMYIGDQWYGLQSGNEKMPIFNIIKGVVKYKIAVVAQNTMSAVYSSMGAKDDTTIKICEALNFHFRKMWELAKMDKQAWNIVKDACIQGDAYIYFSGSNVTESQIINNVNVLLSDEQNSNIQEQKHILIVERRFVSDVKKDAKKYKVKGLDLDLIVADEDNENQIGDKNEVKSKDGKCTSILYMYKDDDGIVHFSRSVKNLIYQPDTKLQAMDSEGNTTGNGLKSYPLVNLVWENQKGKARGCGEVKYLIPNQIELNKTLARRSISIQQNAFGKLAYNEHAISNPDDLDVVGAKIAIKDGSAQNINNMIAYLNPTTMSPDAKNFSDELLTMSKELAGAGDSATGSIDPTQASGTAIIAVRDQAALPLNEQIATYKQFVEDLALMWFDIWVAYNPNGLTIEMDDEEESVVQIPAEVLESLKVNVRIDVSQNNPYSRFAQEQSLEKLFEMQAISFEEYVKALDDDAAVPKGKLQDILDERQIEQQKEMEHKEQLQGLQQQLQQYEGQLQESTNLINQLMGGAQDEMSGMQY